MVRCHRFLLPQVLCTVLLMSSIASRLPAQEPALGAASKDVQTQDEAAKVVSFLNSPEKRHQPPNFRLLGWNIC